MAAGQSSSPMLRQGARPVHAISFPTRLAEIASHEADGQPLEIWFADEARIGQKNKITRRWAKRGARPSAPRDLRTASAYLRGDLPGARQRSGSGAATLYDRGHDAASGRGLAGGAAARPLGRFSPQALLCTDPTRDPLQLYAASVMLLVRRLGRHS